MLFGNGRSGVGVVVVRCVCGVKKFVIGRGIVVGLFGFVGVYGWRVKFCLLDLVAVIFGVGFYLLCMQW